MERRRNAYYWLGIVAVVVAVMDLIVKMKPTAGPLRYGLLVAIAVTAAITLYRGLREEFGDFCCNLQEEISLLKPNGLFGQFLVSADLAELAEELRRAALTKRNQQLAELAEAQRAAQPQRAEVVVMPTPSDPQKVIDSLWQEYNELASLCRPTIEVASLIDQARTCTKRKDQRALLTQAIGIMRYHYNHPGLPGEFVAAS